MSRLFTWISLLFHFNVNVEIHPCCFIVQTFATFLQGDFWWSYSARYRQYLQNIVMFVFLTILSENLEWSAKKQFSQRTVISNFNGLPKHENRRTSKMYAWYSCVTITTICSPWNWSYVIYGWIYYNFWVRENILKCTYLFMSSECR